MKRTKTNKNTNIAIYKKNGKNGLNNFTISKDNANKLIGLLSSSLYSRPGISALRELVSNALDAGGNKKPEIILNNLDVVNGSFIVKDYGEGMSKDDIFNIYCSFGSSNKTDNLDVVGSYGIGAKSPLAITKSFTVKTSKNGECNIFEVTKENEQYGINLLDTYPTDEHGTTVRVDCIKEYQDRSDIIMTAAMYKFYSDDVLEVKDDSGASGNLLSGDKEREVINVSEYEGGDIKALFVKGSYGHYYNPYLYEPLDYTTGIKPSKTALFYRIGGFIYPDPEFSDSLGRTVVRLIDFAGTLGLDTVDKAFIVDVLPGCFDFDASRDGIVNNRRYQKFKKSLFDNVLTIDNIDVSALGEYITHNFAERLKVHIGSDSESSAQFLDKLVVTDEDEETLVIPSLGVVDNFRLDKEKLTEIVGSEEDWRKMLIFNNLYATKFVDGLPYGAENVTMAKKMIKDGTTLKSPKGTLNPIFNLSSSKENINSILVTTENLEEVYKNYRRIVKWISGDKVLVCLPEKMLKNIKTNGFMTFGEEEFLNFVNKTVSANKEKGVEQGLATGLCLTKCKCTISIIPKGKSIIENEGHLTYNGEVKDYLQNIKNGEFDLFLFTGRVQHDTEESRKKIAYVKNRIEADKDIICIKVGRYCNSNFSIPQLKFLASAKNIYVEDMETMKATSNRQGKNLYHFDYKLNKKTTYLETVKMETENGGAVGLFLQQKARDSFLKVMLPVTFAMTYGDENWDNHINSDKFYVIDKIHDCALKKVIYDEILSTELLERMEKLFPAISEKYAKEAENGKIYGWNFKYVVEDFSRIRSYFSNCDTTFEEMKNGGYLDTIKQVEGLSNLIGLMKVLNGEAKESLNNTIECVMHDIVETIEKNLQTSK